MNNLISYCGINCETCEARIATINNDDALRAEIAEKWRQSYNPDITTEMINCTGCRVEGVKIGHWNECQIRLCATTQSFDHCGLCQDMQECKNVKYVHDHLPEAVENLKKLL